MKKIAYSVFPIQWREYLKRLELSDISYRLARGAFWSVSGAFVSRGLFFLSAVFIARFLGKEAFGEFGILRSTISMFLVFTGFGLGLTATKHVAQYKDSDPLRASRFIGLSCVCAFLAGGLIAGMLLIFSSDIASNLLNAPHLSKPLSISAIVLFINALNGSQNGALAGLEAFRSMAKANFLAAIISFPGMLAGTYFGGLDGAVWGLVLSAGLNWWFSHFALRREVRRFGIPMRITGFYREMNVLWSFSLPALLGSIMVGPVNWTCDAVLANQNNGYSDLGVYHAALTISLAISVLNTMAGRAFLPLCIEQVDGGSRRFAFINIIIPWVTAIVLVCPFVFLHEIPIFFLGNDFSDQQLRATIIWVMGYTLIIAHRQGILRNFIAGDYLWWSLGSNFLWGVLAIALTYVFRTHGAQGRAIAFLCAYLVNTIVFAPLWVKWELCDKKLLTSKWCFGLWGILLFSMLLAFSTDFILPFRLAILISVLIVVVLITKKFSFVYVKS